MNSSSELGFSFQPRELFAKLASASQDARTGYWQFQLSATHSSGSPRVLDLAVSQSKVVFSGGHPLSWTVLHQTLQRFIVSLRSATAKQTWQALEQETPPQELETISKVLGKFEKALSIDHQTVVNAIQLQVLSDLDTLADSAGKAEFTANTDLLLQAPITGFKLEDLILQAQHRHDEWQSLQALIPTMEAIPVLQAEAMERSSLSPEQKQQIQKLVSLGKPLNFIAQAMAKDPLETAKMFGKLIRGQLVTLQLPPNFVSATSGPEVFILDDSPVFLQQFQALVKGWGYQVHYWSNTSTAIQKMLDAHPSVIFLDVNMPGMTGFDMIKEVRRQPQLASLSLVLLTAENSLSNQWRAKWGNCKFLAKPRTPEEIPTFQTELRTLLQEVAPLPG
jgi:CheY-like chemotaxis protein